MDVQKTVTSIFIVPTLKLKKEYLNNHNIPDWEVPNMLAKYYTTTKALELAKQKK